MPSFHILQVKHKCSEISVHRYNIITHGGELETKGLFLDEEALKYCDFVIE